MRVGIVGAGLAGLAAAKEVTAAGHDVVVFEAADGPGGRVRTDLVDGYRLDRGFQIMLTAYPECREMLEYDQLDLRTFQPGALVRVGDSFHRVGDPLAILADSRPRSQRRSAPPWTSCEFLAIG